MTGNSVNMNFSVRLWVVFKNVRYTIKMALSAALETHCQLLKFTIMFMQQLKQAGFTFDFVVCVCRLSLQFASRVLSQLLSHVKLHAHDVINGYLFLIYV